MSKLLSAPPAPHEQPRSASPVCEGVWKQIWSVINFPHFYEYYTNPKSNLIILYSVALSSKDLKAVLKHQLINLQVPPVRCAQVGRGAVSRGNHKLHEGGAGKQHSLLLLLPTPVCSPAAPLHADNLWMTETHTERCHIIKPICGKAKSRSWCVGDATPIKNNKPALCFNFLCAATVKCENQALCFCEPLWFWFPHL